VCDTLNGDARALNKYRMLLQQEFETYLRTWLDYYRQEQRWADSEFWQRRTGPLVPISRPAPVSGQRPGHSQSLSVPVGSPAASKDTL
jgi:hypothetical protein